MYGSWDDIDSDSLFSVIAYWQIFTFNKGNANCFAEWISFGGENSTEHDYMGCPDAATSFGSDNRSWFGSSGKCISGVFHNYLVSPDLLGVSNGAGFGAALGMYLAAGSTKWAGVLAFVFGMGSVAFTYKISSMKKERSAMTLVLSGVIVSSVFNALIALIKLAADTDSVLPAITYWLMGSFTGANYKKCAVAGLAVALGGMILCLMRWRINLLSMGDEEARSLGIHPERDRFLVILASTFITAACVTVSGIVGWVGMVIPNIVRRMIGADHCYLIPLSALAGAAFMMAADLGARSICAGEIPVGILTALAGAPLFAVVFARKDGKQK